MKQQSMSKDKFREEILRHIRPVDVKRAVKNIKKAIRAGDEEMSKWLIGLIGETTPSGNGEMSKAILILPAKEVGKVKAVREPGKAEPVKETGKVKGKVKAER